MGQQGAVERFVGKVRRQRFCLKDACKIRRVAGTDDDHKVGVMRRRDEGVHAALVHEHNFVFLAGKTLFVDPAGDAASRNVEDLDTAVKVRLGIRIICAEEFYAVRFVVIEFVVRDIFHNVNNR